MVRAVSEVRRGGGDCRNTEKFSFPVCLKSGVICSEAAPEGRLEVCASYLDQCREALGVTWGRKLGLGSHAREIRLIDVSVTVALEAC